MRAFFLLIIPLLFAQPAFAASAVENVSAPATAAVNEIRAQHGIAAIKPNRKLSRAAEIHTKDMIRKGFFSHTGSDGSTIGTRARSQKYRFCVISENIAQGHAGIEQVLGAWMTSPGHRRNLLNPEVTEFALVRGDGNIWVMMLGRSGC